MGQIVRFIAFVLVLVSPGLAFAYDVAVMPVKGVNLKPGQPEAIGVILAQQYAKASAYSVAGPDVTGPALKGGTDFAGAARTLGAGEYLEPVAVALDSKIVLSVERHGYDGALIHSASMTGVTIDDVPELAARISRALLLRTSTDETRTLDTVTQEEATPRNQTYSVVPKGVKSAIIFPFAKGVDLDPMVSIAFELRVEKRDYFFGFAGGMMLPSDSSDDRLGYGGLFAELSGNYFLTSTNVAPYLGAGISPRLLITNKSSVGFAPFANFGVTFPRESRARVLLEARIAQNVFPLEGSSTEYNYDYANNTYVTSSDPRKGKYPTELSFQFGVVW